MSAWHQMSAVKNNQTYKINQKFQSKKHLNVQGWNPQIAPPPADIPAPWSLTLLLGVMTGPCSMYPGKNDPRGGANNTILICVHVP